MINLYDYDNREKNKPAPKAAAASARIVPYDYGANQASATEQILKNSSAPFKITGPSEISEGHDEAPPLGFVGRAAKAAYDVAKSTVESASDSIMTLFGSLDAHPGNPNGDDYSQPTGETVGMTPEERKDYYDKKQAGSTPLARATDLGRAALGLTNIGFLPVTTQIEAGKQVPILKYPVEAASAVFDNLGKLGSYTLGKAVDVLPMAQQSKDTVKPLAQDLGAFIAQLVGVKVGFKVAEEGGGRLVEKLPVSDETKGKINTAAKVGVGMSIAPFSTAYGYAAGRITAKIHEAQLAGKDITLEEGQKIVDEVKQETKAHVEQAPAETINETTSRLQEDQAKADQSAEETKKLIQEKATEEIEKPLIEQSKKFDSGQEFADAVATKVDALQARVDELEPKAAADQTGAVQREIDATKKQIEQIPKPERLAEIYNESTGTLPIASVSSGLSPEIEERMNKEDPDVRKMVEDIKNGDKLPKVPVYRTGDGGFALNKDGAKRLLAYKLAGESKIPVNIEARTDLDSTSKQARERTAAAKMQSRVYDRLKAEHPEELPDDASYQAINLKEQSERAVELIKTDKEKAYRIAMGAETSPDITSTAVNIAMAEKALADGNFELFNQLTKVRSFEQTRRGQEIVSEKGSVSDNGTARYVKELISAKMSELGKSYLGNLEEYNPFKKKRTPGQKATDIIKKEVDKAKKKIQIKEMDIKQAQSFLDKLACQ